MQIPWPKDPKTEKPSVSLGILVIATACMVVAVGLSLSGVSKDVSLVTEFWLGSCGLYWSRKFTSSKGSALETLTEVEQQLENTKGEQK